MRRDDSTGARLGGIIRDSEKDSGVKDRTLRITAREDGDVTVLDLDGRLVFDDGDAVFRETVNGLIARERVKLVVNLEHVSYIDSAGIGVLVGRLLAVRRRGGDLRLANLTSRSHRVMTITHLLTVFESHDSVDLAVRSFRK
jgi:anti-sigma B factor antagonist